jgi:hypothetical protein
MLGSWAKSSSGGLCRVAQRWFLRLVFLHTASFDARRFLECMWCLLFTSKANRSERRLLADSVEKLRKLAVCIDVLGKV